MKKIFIASGGTGGHIIPARCLATYLAEKKDSEGKNEFKVFFFGDEKYRSYIKLCDDFESKIISSSQLKKSPTQLAKAAIKIAVGIIQSCYFFLTIRPKYLIAFGGYSTFPLLVAAIITKTKIILHEQNSHLGKVNRIFAQFAYKIASSFPVTSGIKTADLDKVIFVGNPVREEILELHKIPYSLPDHSNQGQNLLDQERRMNYDVLLASDFYSYEPDNTQNLFNILIIGGSGGARIFSEVLPKAFFNLSAEMKSKIHITQQCRKELLEDTFNQYKSFNLNIFMAAFFDDMPKLIRESHLVIARSGSSSVFEFCAAKKPMILIPFEQAADNHQEKNARYLEKHDAAIVLTEKEFTINKVSEVIKNLIDSETTLKNMSNNCAALAVLDATENLANLIE